MIFSAQKNEGEQRKLRKKRGKLETVLRNIERKKGNDQPVLNVILLDKEKMRIDILYKSILRDFRKYYVQDFNVVTKFRLRIRYKGIIYYLQSLKDYLTLRFPELYR